MRISACLSKLSMVAGADFRLLSYPGLGLTRCLPVVANQQFRIHYTIKDTAFLAHVNLSQSLDLFFFSP